MTLFSSKHLKVRLLKVEDFKQFYLLQSNPEVLKYTVVNPNPTREGIFAELQNLIRGYTNPDNHLRVWAIEDQSGDFIGTCALVKGECDYEIGYRILPDYWGRGYGTELCSVLLKYGFEVLKLPRIVAVAAKPNIASVKILDLLMDFDKETFNCDFRCVDRHYVRLNDVHR